MNMNPRRFKIFDNFLLFIIAGVLITIFVGLFILFSYVLIWGVIIGGILWLLAMIKNYLFSNTPTKITPPKKQGRVIEHDDNK